MSHEPLWRGYEPCSLLMENWHTEFVFVFSKNIWIKFKQSLQRKWNWSGSNWLKVNEATYSRGLEIFCIAYHCLFPTEDWCNGWFGNCLREPYSLHNSPTLLSECIWTSRQSDQLFAYVRAADRCFALDFVMHHGNYEIMSILKELDWIGWHTKHFQWFWTNLTGYR